MRHGHLPQFGTVCLENYELLEKLDEGGTAELYLARHLRGKQTVVIKISPRHDDSQGDQRSQNEGSALSGLKHPNIVTLIEAGETADARWLVLERFHGLNLKAHMEEGMLWPVQRAFPILMAVANALSYLHDKNLLHLDLKPENVLVEEQSGTVKLTDFGLALTLEEAAKGMELTEARGSLDYAAPEQRFGLPMDQRTDVYSFAALCYELLTGRAPGRVYVPLTFRSVNLPLAVDHVLSHGLARPMDERPPSVLAFRNLLCAALKDVLPCSLAAKVTHQTEPPGSSYATDLRP